MQKKNKIMGFPGKLQKGISDHLGFSREPHGSPAETKIEYLGIFRRSKWKFLEMQGELPGKPGFPG